MTPIRAEIGIPTVPLSIHRCPPSRLAYASGSTVRDVRDPVAAAPAGYQDPRLSPSGTQLAVSAAADISVWTFATKALARLTFTQGAEFNPVWMPDGRRVVFDANEGGGNRRILRKAADGTEATDVLTPPPGGFPIPSRPTAGSSSTTRPPRTRSRCCWTWSAARRSGRSFREHRPRPSMPIAPDGHWIASSRTKRGISRFTFIRSRRWTAGAGGFFVHGRLAPSLGASRAQTTVLPRWCGCADVDAHLQWHELLARPAGSVVFPPGNMPSRSRETTTSRSTGPAFFSSRT